MSLPNAFITLLTTSSYLPGALVLLHALHELHPAPRDFKIVCPVTPETVDAKTIGSLRQAGYDLVIGVEPIGSGVQGQPNLELMGRPDLNLALTKLHLFRLAPLFSTLIYLDADVLPLRPIDHLFSTTSPHPFSACPDIGWPDCFNSGVMVIRPRESDWTGLKNLLKNGEGDDGIYAVEGLSGNGSFDGADQGLLNEWFSEEGGGGAWNRLPFLYNVTPSAAYQWTPAYRRFGHKINAVHFIGPNKPWANLARRPAGVSQSQSDEVTYDYPSLVDRWYAIYDKNVRPTAAHAPDLASRFAVPETVAVWNRSGVPQQPSDRLDLDQLKEMAEKGGASLKSGQYLSLPVDGRVDLIMPKPQPRQKSAPQPSVPILSPQPQPVKSSSRPTSWDATRYSPPKETGPEMSIPIATSYDSAWDAPPAQQASYYHAPKSHTEPQYPTLPASVTNDSWYKDYTGVKPDRNQVHAVFPWEQPGQTHRQPDRVFPRGDTPPPQTTSKQGPAHTQQDQAPQRPQSMVDAMASYSNAWDSMPSIQRYVDRITGKRSKPASPTSSQNQSPSSNRPHFINLPTSQTKESIVKGLQSVPGTPGVEAIIHSRETSLDKRSDASGDGDDEKEDESSSEDGAREGNGTGTGKDGSPAMGWSVANPGWGKNPQLTEGANKARYRDRHLQDKSKMSDSKPSIRHEDGSVPDMTFEQGEKSVQTPHTRSTKPRQSRRTSSSDTGTARPLVTPSDSFSSSGGRRAAGSKLNPNPNEHGAAGGLHDAVESVGDGLGGAGGQIQGSTRKFDPKTDIDLRKTDTQEVLSRFLKVGHFKGS